MTSFLSPPRKQPTIGTTSEKEEQLPKPPDDIFNTKLIAAMINRDTVLREVRDCIQTGDEQRCKKLSKQIHAKWRSLSVHNGCVLLDNKLAIPNSLKEWVIDVLHSTHPGAWGMTELGQRIWWPFINRDLINKSKTCRPCTEFGKNLKSINPKSHWAPLPQCSEPNEEIQLDFGGPIFDGQGREVYFLACIDRFSKFPTLKLVTHANGPNIEKFLNKYIGQHGVPRNIRLDQARCLRGNKVELLCAKHNINLIYAPANDHRPIGLVERLIQTVKRRLGCIKLDPNQRPFNIKNALRDIFFELRICRKKYSKLSPFEAYYDRKPNTTLSNITTKPNKNNLSWTNTFKYLDDNIIGDEELISEERWYDEDLDSEAEVQEAKRQKLEDAKSDNSEIPRIFTLPSTNIQQPLARQSPRLQLARRTLAAQSNKKQLQGIYEAIPEGAALVKTTDTTLNIKVPRQQDTVLNKSDVARFGTADQRKIPLINFAARKTVCKPHKKFIDNMEQHAKEQRQKILGQRNIRKRDTQATKADRHIKSNLSKVNRIKIPKKKLYTPSPRKRAPKKRKDSIASSQDSNQEDNMYQETDDSQDMYMAQNIGQPRSPSDPNVNIVADQQTHDSKSGKDKTRRSTRPKRETKRYGDTTNLDFLDSSDEEQPPHKRHAASVASYSPPKTTMGDPPTPPANSTIPVTSTSRNNITTGPALQSQDEINMVYTGDNEAEQSRDDNERHLQPHEF